MGVFVSKKHKYTGIGKCFNETTERYTDNTSTIKEIYVDDIESNGQLPSVAFSETGREPCPRFYEETGRSRNPVGTYG